MSKQEQTAQEQEPMPTRDTAHEPTQTDAAPEPEAPKPEAGGDEIERLQQALTDARAEVEVQRNEVLRLHAEMDNLRKRVEKDVQNAHKYALERFVEGLLPVVDSLEMGLEAAARDEASVDTIREGTEMTLRMMLQALEKNGVEVVSPEGERFDPDLHQAMSMQPDDGEPNRVVGVMQKGYRLNGRVVRPALVVVSKPA
ncbi:MAG: nucleotide exchange factor GrpE [Halothiobacillaceae bacterium]